ncbi:hypothetical protein ACA910_015770 [Epithemia clementina (nom. ined.)]
MMTARKRLVSNNSKQRSKKAWISMLLISVIVLFGSLFLIYLFTFFALLWNVTTSTSSSSIQEVESSPLSSNQQQGEPPPQPLKAQPPLNLLQTALSNDNNQKNVYDLRKQLEDNIGMLSSNRGPRITTNENQQQLPPPQLPPKEEEEPPQNFLSLNKDPIHWRYDDVNLIRPIHTQDNGDRRSDIPFLSCIPKEHRLPPLLTNVSEYFMHPQNVYPTREYLFDYNPSIVKIPSSLFLSADVGGDSPSEQERVQQATTNHNHTTTTNNNNKKTNNSKYWKEQGAYFLASFRVSNKNYCFHPDDRKRMTGEIRADTAASSRKQNLTKGGAAKGATIGHSSSKEYLGLAVLDHNLQFLSSVVVNVKAVSGFHAAEDFRLFVLHQQLYLATYDVITPLWLWDDPKQLLSSPTSTANSHAHHHHHHHHHHPANYTVVPTVFGNEQDDFMVWVGKHKSCAGCNRANACGKNLNYFVVPDDSTLSLSSSSAHLTHNSDRNYSLIPALVEIWPSPPHLVHSLDLTQPCHRASQPRQTFASQQSPIRSFATIDELLFPHISHHDNRGIFTRGHGGACCIELPYTNNGNNQNEEKKPLHTMFVGIQHSKTPWQSPQQRRRQQAAATTTTSSNNNNNNNNNNNSALLLQANHYVSSFYAFETTPPFRLIAQSGYFCLPFAPTNTKHGQDESLSQSIVQATAWRTLKLGSETFANCPRIHFVSGMVLVDTNDDEGETKGGGSSSSGEVILSYGVNDCYSRFLRIPSSEILRLLFLDNNNNNNNNAFAG